VATQLFHDKTGAEHLHITRQDKNNVFAIGFGTPSMDSTGVAHILVHTYQIVSNKTGTYDAMWEQEVSSPRSVLQNAQSKLCKFYECFHMCFSSLLGLQVAQDNTFYPFATTNPTDYKNLQSVYLDSTLDPLLRELDFRQEGWRLEHVDPRDPTTPITFKGIVFNEMKGVMSDAGSLYFDEFQKHMYPGTIYGCNSGGNPLDIPALTFDGLKNFHKAHYHPSNAKTFTYGTSYQHHH
jgi:Zn-dependent M16 (insulinase) family peptidase